MNRETQSDTRGLKDRLRRGTVLISSVQRWKEEQSIRFTLRFPWQPAASHSLHAGHLLRRADRPSSLLHLREPLGTHEGLQGDKSLLMVATPLRVVFYGAFLFHGKNEQDRTK